MEFRTSIETEDFHIPRFPEGELIYSIIFRAIADVVSGSRDTKLGQVKQDARRWLLSEEMFPFSFAWCCEAINLPESMQRYIRNAVLTGRSSQKLLRVVRHY